MYKSKQHYEENKEYYIKKAKKRKEEKPEDNKKYLKKYYHKDSPEEGVSTGCLNKRNSRAKQRAEGNLNIYCECGVKVNRNNMARHKTSKKHLEYLKMQNAKCK